MTNTNLNRPDEQLEYIIKDCQEAIGANPLGANTEIYLNLARSAEKELNRRQRLRYFRKESKIPLDILEARVNMPISKRKGHIKTQLELKNAYWVQNNRVNQRTGALNLGLIKLHLK